MHHLRHSHAKVASALTLALAVVLGATFGWTDSAVAQEASLEVVPAAELAEIGKDLVFTFTLNLPAGQSIAKGSVECQTRGVQVQQPLRLFHPNARRRRQFHGPWRPAVEVPQTARRFP